jgi:tetratricopeptide (TPR) repeat protein
MAHRFTNRLRPRMRIAVGASVAIGFSAATTMHLGHVRHPVPASLNTLARSASYHREMAPATAGSRVDGMVAEAERAVTENPRDGESLRTLAIAFMRKQRQCGDPGYYRRAMAAIERSLELEPNSYESRKMKAWVLAGQHRFAEARNLAQQCVKHRPHDAWNYGTLADAQAELGDYPAAVAAVQRMIDRKPDLSSYSRAAHLRELHGDLEGALQLYALALDCTDTRDSEAVAWVHVQRGNVRLAMGAARGADEEYQQALAVQPAYHLALAGRARCQAALGYRREAIRWYEQALAVVPRPDWAIALGELKQATGDKTGAQAQFALARAATTTAGTSVDVDRQMALFLADHGDPQAALEHARRAASARSDIYTCDALAWALYKNHRYEEAWSESRKARRLGTRDAALLRHAALIPARVPGAAGQAGRLLQQARRIDPSLAGPERTGVKRT